MPFYRLAGQNFCFSHSVTDLVSFEIKDEVACGVDSFDPFFLENEPPRLICRARGWVGNAQRYVEVYATSSGMLLHVEGCAKFFITSDGQTICKWNLQEPLKKLELDVILGPALVLALALHNIWSLHAGAAMFTEKVIVFLGESGQGKSTLAAYLSSNSGWRLVADDILPVRMDVDGAKVLPHFPQLKLPVEVQPGIGLPEHLPLTRLCVLTPAGQDTMPELQVLPPALAIQALLHHTAGTRMFTPEMLGKHLSFCSLVAGQVPVYQLRYPHRKDTLPGIRDLLESLC